MQSFLQSAFLQALAQSLIASIWQMALLWLGAVCVLRLFKWSSSQKFNIAFFAQLSGFIVFIFTFINTYNKHYVNFITAGTNSFILNMNQLLAQWMPYITVVYLSILIFKFSKFVFIYKQTKGLRKYGLKKIAPANRIFVQEMAQLFSLKRKVSIYLSEKIICPLTVGFLKPVILIPVAAVNHLTTEQMEAVILHELAHIKRADYLLFILQNLIDKIFFFNIFSIMLGNIIERERENACDDWVLQFRYNSMHYAEALFKLGRLKALPALAMSFTGKKESLLLFRIKRLLHNQTNKTSYNLQSILFASFSLLMMAFILISSSVKIKEQTVAKAGKPTALKQVSYVQPVIEKTVASTKAIQSEKTNKIITKKEDEVALANNQKESDKAIAAKAELEAEKDLLASKQNYLIQVQQALDSIHQALPTINEAINSQLIVTPDIAQKVISYQNFKQIENMLAAAGSSVNVTETDDSKDSFRKQITIEATDKYGNKHIYNVIVELYQ